MIKKTLVAGLFAVATATVALPAIAADYVTNATEIVKAADWETMQTITVELDEYSYSMEKIELEQGKVYKLELKNSGEEKHYFTAPKFFKNIATRKAQVNGQAEVKAPYFTAIEVAIGGQLDLYFVAANAGSYEVYCTVGDHREEGMEGSIVIK